jgi:hypothetical protein
LATGNKKEAIDILQNAAKCNGMDTEKVQVVVNGLAPDLKNENKATLSALFATRELARRNVLLYINWYSSLNRHRRACCYIKSFQANCWSNVLRFFSVRGKSR